MKNTRRFLSVLLSCIIVVHTMSLSAFAATSHSLNVQDTLYINVNSETRVSEIALAYDAGVIYAYSDANTSYCAQISDSGYLQYSYVLSSSNKIYESELLEIDEVYKAIGKSATNDTSYYADINSFLLNNLAVFDQHILPGSTETTHISDIQPMGYSTISSAITSTFGNNYTVAVANSNESHNGVYYRTYVYETQTTSYTSVQSYYFNADTALSSVISWALAGGFTWIGTIASIIEDVVTTVLSNGITYIVKNFTAQKTDVTHYLTRTVEVSGYSGVQYWSGWTRKMYFFKGDLGWTHDVNYHYDFKHSDFDNTVYLLDKGFSNFVSNVLGA